MSADFTCYNGTTFWGQNVYAVGSIPELGSWNTTNAVPLSPTAYPTWTGTVNNLPASTYVEWKCIKKYNGQVVWQSGANNSFTTPASGTTSTSGSF
ncbi:MAG: carbohydrate-binding module family 20 domain-containing protein [Acidobacteriota bacterium]|nr:carbohydrate-binding module family 20 domain-containing protein [Acidobacteriota bacterium]